MAEQMQDMHVRKLISDKSKQIRRWYWKQLFFISSRPRKGVGKS
jgi:hypothetical protein